MPERSTADTTAMFETLENEAERSQRTRSADAVSDNEKAFWANIFRLLQMGCGFRMSQIDKKIQGRGFRMLEMDGQILGCGFRLLEKDGVTLGCGFNPETHHVP